MWLRAGEPEDSPHLIAIQRAASLAGYRDIFPPERFPFPEQQVAAQCWRILTDRTYQVLVGIGDDGPVGFVSCRAERVEKLYVHPAHWRRGYGSRLLAAAVDAIRHDGHPVARLWVLADNAQARGMYERHGWTPDGSTNQATYPPFPAEVGYALYLTGDLTDQDRRAGTATAAPISGSGDAPAVGTGTAPERTDPPRD